ncbi:MAG TPA: hypothetical protein PKH53_09205, partial [Candidatus Saccharicenans sp.]|nr:hypothetical protein [Candidatus Saccharicenans sp.]
SLCTHCGYLYLFFGYIPEVRQKLVLAGAGSFLCRGKGVDELIALQLFHRQIAARSIRQLLSGQTL